MDEALSDSETDNFASDNLNYDSLLSKLTLILLPLSEIPVEKFSPFDLRSGQNHGDKRITDHMYALHIAYLFWKIYRKLNETLPLIIQRAIENVKPRVRENRKLLRSFVQKRLTEFSLMERNGGILLAKGQKIVVSKGMAHTVIKWYHDKLSHPTITTLFKVLKSQFFIWGLDQNLLKILFLEIKCDICASNIILPKRTHSNHIKSFEIFERIQIDLIQIAYENHDNILLRRGYKWVLTVIDCFSKYAWAYPLKTKETNRICEILVELFNNEGIPSIMQSDNGGEFVSKLIRNLMPKLGIKLINGSPYSPTTQGQIERFNRTLKCLLRKEIHIEMSKNDITVVEDWANELVSRVIDIYRNKIHRSLSRTPWEVYKNRNSPHPLKNNLQLESIRPEEIEICYNFNDIKGDIRHNADIKEKINIETLDQTRRVQNENTLRVKKKNYDSNYAIGTILFMRNPTISKIRKKKSFLECLNIKVKIVDKHFSSSQYQIEYNNSIGEVKRMWVNNAELYKGSNSSFLVDELIEVNVEEKVPSKLSLKDYKKLVMNFEQYIAEMWANSRKMKQQLLTKIDEDDKLDFCNLDDKFNNKDDLNSSNLLNFYGKLVYKFCADVYSIKTDLNSTNIDCILKYLAYKGFKKHLGFLQLWYHSRLQDEKGYHFSKILETIIPSTKHDCRVCIFSDHCAHECCFRLLSFTFYQRNSANIQDNCELTMSTNKSDNNENSREILEKMEIKDANSKMKSESLIENIFLNESNEQSDDSHNMGIDNNIDNNREISEILKIPCNTDSETISFYIGEDYFKPISIESKKKLITEKLNLKINLDKSLSVYCNTYMKLRNCTSKKKVSIIPDGNCLYRALSWCLTDREEFHELVRAKLIDFMRTSTICEKYVSNKSNQSVDEYILKNNICKLKVWGSDVEIFCAAIWLETDIFVLVDNNWNKFSYLGFNPRKGCNSSSKQGIYLENSCFHFEPIISVARH